MSNPKVVTLETLLARIEALESRNRGPKSERAMTEADAHMVKFGQMRDLAHREAAEKLGLSYGQIYSARGGYTFKDVTK